MGNKDQALGRSRGGLSTKIHLVCDAQGKPIRLPSPGERPRMPHRRFPC